MRKFRIAQVAPVAESVPPKGYGGVERVVFYLTEQLVREGHSVTLYASGDSITTAALEPIRKKALRLDDPTDDYRIYHQEAVHQVLREANNYDIIHFHTEPLHFPYARETPCAILTTLHGRLDLEHIEPLYRKYADLPMVSISDAQRAPMPWLNWQATVHHGLPIDLYKPTNCPRNYLAFLGRIAPEKRLDRAIKIARSTGQRLKIAAKVDPVDQEYYASEILPLLDNMLIEFIGEISDREKVTFLNGARALLFPGDWPEPFGLTLIESLACGTPVIAMRHGAVSEIIEHGRTGFILESMEQAADAVDHIDHLDRRDIRNAFEQRFRAERMVQDYIRIYTSMARK